MNYSSYVHVTLIYRISIPTKARALVVTPFAAIHFEVVEEILIRLHAIILNHLPNETA